MHQRRSTDLPLCPVCGARHMPATNGAWERVWCDGSLAEAQTETETARAARFAMARASARKLGLLEPSGLVAQARNNLERAKARKRIRKERTARADAPPIDAIDQARIPEGM